MHEVGQFYDSVGGSRQSVMYYNRLKWPIIIVDYM